MDATITFMRLVICLYHWVYHKSSKVCVATHPKMEFLGFIPDSQLITQINHSELLPVIGVDRNITMLKISSREVTISSRDSILK